MRNQWDLKENQQETSEGHAKPTRHTWKSRRSLEKPTRNHREINIKKLANMQDKQSKPSRNNRKPEEAVNRKPYEINRKPKDTMRKPKEINKKLCQNKMKSQEINRRSQGINGKPRETKRGPYEK